jgi:hypothetical protein
MTTYEQAAKRCNRKAHKNPGTPYYVVRDWDDQTDRVEYLVVDEPTLNFLQPHAWDVLRYQVVVGGQSDIQ